MIIVHILQNNPNYSDVDKAKFICFAARSMMQNLKEKNNIVRLKILKKI